VQIDDKPERIGLRHPVDIGLVGDAQATLRELLRFLPRNDDRAFLEQAQAGMRQWWALMEERGTSDDMPMKPPVVAWHLAELLDDDAILTGDSGTVTTWAGRMRLRRNQRFSFSGTLCSMAAALPYAIGAQTAFPERQVVAFTGDGSLSMMLGDFATLAQHKLPVKVVVLKNNTLGLIKWEQMIYLGNPEYGVDLYPIDFVKTAEACGGRGVRIEDPARCGDQLRDALAMDGPVLVEAVVDPHEPPMPPKIRAEQALHFAESLARGTPNRGKIALTVASDTVRELV
jgi:pyruvate dehydrogenase (quinone)